MRDEPKKLFTVKRHKPRFVCNDNRNVRKGYRGLKDISGRHSKGSVHRKEMLLVFPFRFRNARSERRDEISQFLSIKALYLTDAETDYNIFKRNDIGIFYYK